MYRQHASLRALCLLGLVLCVAIPPAAGAVAWNEIVDGPLSSSGSTPTALSLTSGSNTIFSTFGGSSQFDYFTFTLTAGQSLNGFELDS